MPYTFTCMYTLTCTNIDMCLVLAPLSVEHFWMGKTALQSQVQHLVEQLKAVAPQKLSTGKCGSYKAITWSGWDEEQRGAGAAAELCRSAGIRTCKLRSRLSCPRKLGCKACCTCLHGSNGTLWEIDCCGD